MKIFLGLKKLNCQLIDKIILRKEIKKIILKSRWSLNHFQILPSMVWENPSSPSTKKW